MAVSKLNKLLEAGKLRKNGVKGAPIYEKPTTTESENQLIEAKP